MKLSFIGRGRAVNEGGGKVVTLDVPVDLVLMIAVEAERIKYLGKVQMWQMSWYRFRRDALPPHDDDGADQGARSPYDWLTSQYRVIRHHIWMFSAPHHFLTTV